MPWLAMVEKCISGEHAGARPVLYALAEIALAPPTLQSEHNITCLPNPAAWPGQSQCMYLVGLIHALGAIFRQQFPSTSSCDKVD